LTKECEGKANNIRLDQSRASCSQFAKISYSIDTTIKKGLNVLLAMVIMIKFKFEIQTD